MSSGICWVYRILSVIRRRVPAHRVINMATQSASGATSWGQGGLFRHGITHPLPLRCITLQGVTGRRPIPEYTLSVIIRRQGRFHTWLNDEPYGVRSQSADFLFVSAGSHIAPPSPGFGCHAFFPARAQSVRQSGPPTQPATTTQSFIQVYTSGRDQPCGV